MVKIRRHMAPLTRTSGRGNPCKYITIHETANRGRGANANAHARLQAGTNSRQASWHYQVDSTEIVQSFDDNVRCWHAGTKANNESIAIEICVNSDGNYDKAVANAAALVAHLRKKHGIPATRVVSHKFWTGKNCPTIMLAQNGRWSRFIAATNPSGTTTVATPAKTTTKKASWFSMATKTELREIIRDEIARRSSWGYKGAGNRDAWAILRNTENVVEELSETVGSKVWSHTNPYTDTDIYAYLRATHRSAVATEGKVAGLTAALKAISQGRDINLDEVRQAAEQGVSEALKSIDADITIHVNTEGE